jgi:methylmalonyl-CoA mutase cobalamin-binding subunit
MRLTLVGADVEENLGMGMIAAAATGAGHRVEVLGFNDTAQAPDLVNQITSSGPDLVGLAAQYQHRGLDFLALATALRKAGFRGHITAGGHFASMGCAEVLAGRYGVDSVVLYDGEETIVDLLAALAARRNLADVAGIAFRDARGAVVRTAPRCLPHNLDDLPIARRYRPHARHMRIPFVPVSGSRGCWASCSFCSITTVLRDARAHGAHGKLLRLRSPENVAAELAVLGRAVGGSAIFCFHDENFLLPRPADSLARVGAIRRYLDEAGMERSAFVGKCRPDTVTPELARRLAELGVIRLYVGVENASQRGADHLNRRVSVASMGQALEACSDAGIIPCYNLLIFEPETMLDDVAENIAFMRRFAEHPVNFCRAEPYLGTPLHRQLAQTGSLSGSFLGWDYRLADDRAELLFRISSAAFRERNFASDGVANRYMGLNYSCGVLDWFYRVGDIRKERLRERARELTKNISLDTAELLEQALDLASELDPHDDDRIARETAQLGLRVAASDRVWHAALDALMSDLRAFAAIGRRRETVQRRPAGQVVRAAQGAAFAGWLALWAPGCNSGGLGLPHDGGHRDATKDYMIADMLPPPDGNTVYDRLPSPDASIVYDPVPGPDASFYQPPDTAIIADPVPPPDASFYQPPDGNIVYDPLPPPDASIVYDPPPPDAGRRDFGAVDPLVPDAGRSDLARDTNFVTDPPPPDAGRSDIKLDSSVIYDPVPPPDAGRPDAGRDSYMIADMLPPSDAGVQKVDAPFPVSDPPVAPIGALSANRGAPGSTEGGGHWADTTPRRSPRARDLPLCLPPEIRIAGEWVDGAVQVCLTGAEEPLSIRWQSDGEVTGTDRQVTWTPSSDDDQLNVAVRSRDGVAVGELRLGQVRGRRG